MIYYKTDSPTLRIPDYTIVFDSKEEYDIFISKIYDENGNVKLPDGFSDQEYLELVKLNLGITV